MSGTTPSTVGRERAAANRRLLAVLGPYRGGTSVVTAVLERLGVFVGHRFFDGNTGYPTYEAVGLLKTCRHCFDPRPQEWRHLGNREDRIQQLRTWGIWAAEESVRCGRLAAGGKHPVLCKLIPELEEAWKFDGAPPLLVAVERSPADVLASWDRATTPDGDRWWPRKDRAQVVRDLIASRDAALEHRSHVRIEFDSLRQRPRETIEQLAATCGLPTAHAERASSLVRLRRRDFGS